LKTVILHPADSALGGGGRQGEAKDTIQIDYPKARAFVN
jgi:hypothetical protein